METMMKAPACPEHERLVLDLAQGRLDDAAAAEADAVRTGCPVCSAWWREELEGDLAATLDTAVEQAFDQFTPARRRIPAWMPAAAAAVVAVGAGVLWYGSGDVAVDGTSTVVQESFDGDLDGDGTVDPSDLGFAVYQAGGDEAIFADSLDAGDLSDWTSNT
jgi:hypothetical protein